MDMFEGIVVPTMSYCCEAWAVDWVVWMCWTICGMRWFD